MAEYSLGMRLKYGRVRLVLCPARVHLMARNGPVNEVRYSWANSQNVVGTNYIARSLIVT